MQIRRGYAWIPLVLASFGWTQQPAAGQVEQAPQAPTHSKLNQLLESKVTTEWEAFKKKDKKAYSDLLADDFAAVEDDNQGIRTKPTAVAEVDRSVVNSYHLFALTVIPLASNSALVTTN